MAMSLCARALRLSRAARPLLLRTTTGLTRSVHTAPRPSAASPSVTSNHNDDHHHDSKLGLEEEHEEEVHNMFLKNPDSFGFSDDPEADLWNARTVFFTSVTLCLVFGSVVVYYLPDPKMDRWAVKEAERLIKLREAQGLPLMTENYYNPDSLVLPDDGEE